MSSYPYEDALNNVTNIVQHLTPNERLRLLGDLATIIRLGEKPKPRHKITEFRGIAKDFWKDVDVQKYIDEERNSWGG